MFWNGWDGGGPTRDGGLIESEEDGTEKGCGLLIRVGTEVGMNVDDESRADSRE